MAFRCLFTLDVLHGYETIFPIPLGEASAFDPALWQQTASAAAAEAAAEGIALTFAPMLDVARDPRWGRIAESPGEDPFVGARFAEAKVRGFQQLELAEADAVAATAKHFAGYGAVTAGREYASADISARTLEEVHLPPFAAAVRAGVAAVMPAFIDLAGEPMTAHRGMLDGILRRRWGFEGVIVSDFCAVRELIVHGVAADAVEAAALALNAGVDIDMESGVYLEGLPEAFPAALFRKKRSMPPSGACLSLRRGLGFSTNRSSAGAVALSSAQRAAASRASPRGRAKIHCASAKPERDSAAQGRGGPSRRRRAPRGRGRRYAGAVACCGQCEGYGQLFGRRQKGASRLADHAYPRRQTA